MTLQELTTELWDKLHTWATTAFEMLPNLALALIVLVAGWGLARFTKNIAERALSRSQVNGQVGHLLALIARYAVLVGALFVALGVMNLDKTVTSLLAGVGVVGLALGFAFQDIAANFMSGVMMALRRPFSEGDIICTNGFEGTVEEVNLRATHVREFSGELVIIPNKDVFGSPIENFSENGTRRVEVQCGVSYDDDLREVRRIAVDVAENIQHRTADKPVDFWYTDFGGSSINFVLRFWIDYDQKPFLAARSEAIIALKQAFDEAGVDIPYPIRTLAISDGLKQRVDRVTELREAS